MTRHYPPRAIEFPWDDPFQVRLIAADCPTCGATSGVPCSVRGGAPERITHLARQDRSMRAERKAAR